VIVGDPDRRSGTSLVHPRPVTRVKTGRIIGIDGNGARTPSRLPRPVRIGNDCARRTLASMTRVRPTMVA
jgi:hypothetical protein